MALPAATAAAIESQCNAGVATGDAEPGSNPLWRNLRQAASKLASATPLALRNVRRTISSGDVVSKAASWATISRAVRPPIEGLDQRLDRHERAVARAGIAPRLEKMCGGQVPGGLARRLVGVQSQPDRRLDSLHQCGEIEVGRCVISGVAPEDDQGFHLTLAGRLGQFRQGPRGAGRAFLQAGSSCRGSPASRSSRGPVRGRAAAGDDPRG